MPIPQRELTEMEIKEGSFVGDGDNPEAHIVLTKSKKSFVRKVMDWVKGDVEAEPVENKKFMSTSEILAEDRFSSEFNKLRNAFFFSVDWALSMPADEIPELLAKSVSEFSSEMGDLLMNLKAAMPGEHESLKSIVNALHFESDTKDLNRESFAESLKALESFEMPKANPETVADATKEEGIMPNAEKSIEDVLSGLSEADQLVVKSAMESAKAAASEAKVEAEKSKTVAAEVEAVNKTLSDRVDALEAREAHAEFVAKAREIGSGDVEETASALMAAYGVNKATGETVEKALRAAAAQSEKSGLFTEVGKSGSGAEGEMSPEAELNKIVADKVKANPALTSNAAFSEAVNENPELALRAIAG